MQHMTTLSIFGRELEDQDGCVDTSKLSRGCLTAQNIQQTEEGFVKVGKVPSGKLTQLLKPWPIHSCFAYYKYIQI